MSIKSFVLVLTAAALAGASQASPATGPESPETDGSPGCDKSSPLYPHAETFAATAVRPTRATLRAGAWTCVGRDENGELIRADWARESRALSYYYEWGPTRRYGSRSQVLQTVRDEATGIRSALQALIVDGLRPGLTYHYRVVVRSELYPRRGWSRGADMTLTTPNKSVRDRLCSNPVIRRARPLNVAAGELLRLTGTGLGRSGILTIGGRRAVVVAWSPRAITARLPDRVSGRSRVVAICGESVSTLRTPDAPQVRVIAGKAG
jgi:hypothetical protein